MSHKARFLNLILLSLAFVSVSQESRAQVNPRASCGKVAPVFRENDALIHKGSIGWIPKVQVHFWVRCFRTGSQSPVRTIYHPPHGPDGVYAKIPARDELGRDQFAMFHAWNPDPVGRHQANLRALNPILAEVVRKAQADNPSQRFVIGSGKRNGRLQRMALAWGWSRTLSSPHQSGDAVDLWPLDREGRVFFDRMVQNRIASAMKKAAAELGVSIRWGGHFHGFKNADRAHFELARP